VSNYKIERGVPIDKSDINPNPWNPNKTTKRQQSAIAQSINLYGQVLEILVRPSPDEPGKYQIIDGEHRYQELPDKVFANVIHNLPDADAKKLTIVLNETRGQADKIELAQLLADIEADLGGWEEAIAALPYGDQEYQELVKLAAHDWDDYDSSDLPTNSNESSSNTDRRNSERSPNGYGSDEEDEEESGDKPMSVVGVVQLFLTAEARTEFEELVEQLNPVFGTNGAGSCVLVALRKAIALVRDTSGNTNSM
jgi:hypothetical protein